MKKLRVLGFVLAFIAICYALALGIHTFVNHYLDKPPGKATVSCIKRGQDHLVVIKDGVAIPANTSAKLCDRLTIKNADAQIRLVAFGEHERHQPYDGVEEKVLDKNQSFNVTLNQTGSFKFHDHLDDSAQGIFTVR